MKKTRHAEVLARFTAPTPSVQELMAAGKSLREKVPNKRDAEFRLQPERPDPVFIIKEQAKTRLSCGESGGMSFAPACCARQ